MNTNGNKSVPRCLCHWKLCLGRARASLQFSNPARFFLSHSLRNANVTVTAVSTLSGCPLRRNGL